MDLSSNLGEQPCLFSMAWVDAIWLFGKMLLQRAGITGDPWIDGIMPMLFCFWHSERTGEGRIGSLILFPSAFKGISEVLNLLCHGGSAYNMDSPTTPPPPKEATSCGEFPWTGKISFSLRLSLVWGKWEEERQKKNKANVAQRAEQALSSKWDACLL